MYAHVWIVVARATDCCSSFSLRALAESLAPAPARVCGCGARGHLHIMRVGGACPYSSPPTALCGSVVTKRSALNNARETRLLQHFHFTQCRLQRKLHSAHKRHKAAAESTPEKPRPASDTAPSRHVQQSGKHLARMQWEEERRKGDIQVSVCESWQIVAGYTQGCRLLLVLTAPFRISPKRIMWGMPRDMTSDRL